MADETTTDTLAEIEGQAEQPVQVREGRWRTRNGEIRYVTPTPAEHSQAGRCSWQDAYYYETWYPSGRYSLSGEHPLDLVEYLGPIEPEPECIITPDDVAAEALAGVHDSAVVANPFQEIRELRQKLETTEAALLEQRQRNEQLVTQGRQQHMQIVELQAQVAFLKNRELTLGTRLDEEKAVTTKRLQQVEELRSEVSYVQGLLGDERRRFAELETLTSDLRAVNAATEKAMNSAAREKADLQHRLDTVAAEWELQARTIQGLQTQLEAVKAELVQVSKDRHALQVELDAREQVPEAVSDRWEEGWDDGTARAVETIAEWTAPLRTCGSQALAYHVLQNLPHIMRTLTGLTDED